MGKVWSYWECPNCQSIVRGDCRTCPNCSRNIPDSVKYLMPDNAKVMAAVDAGTVLTADNQTVKNVEEAVPEELASDKPNWICEYCNSQNKWGTQICESCGSPKSEAKRDYFGNSLKQTDAAPEPQDDSEIVSLPERTFDSEPEADHEAEPQSVWKSIMAWLDRNSRQVIGGIGTLFGVAIIFTLIILTAVPVEMHAYMSHKNWSRSIAVETYTQCFENDWSLPSDAILIEEKQEEHHKDKILDHYETKTKRVSERVLDHYETRYRTKTRRVQDGYDTHYRDLGNGQAEKYETPRYKTETYEEAYKEPVYKTVYHNETYEEPVYRYDPVYKTKYYFEIGRWKQTGSLTSSGTDDEPYWRETDIPDNVSEPQYGDKRQGGHTESYSAYFVDENGKTQEFNVSYDEYESLKPEAEKVYKVNRFTKDPC